MKTIRKIFAVSILLFLSACAAGGNNNSAATPHEGYVEGIPFDYFLDFNYNGDNYQIAFPVINEEASYFLYQETEYTTSASTWIVNYYYEAPYSVSNAFTDEELLEEVYNSLINKKEDIENLLGYEIDLRNPNVVYEEEVQIDNPFNEEINCVVVDKYFPIRLQNNREHTSYTIALPIQRYYLATFNGQIVSPIDGTIISWEDFLAIPRIKKR